MNLSSFATLFLGLLAAASAMDMIALDEGQLAEIELRRQAKGSSKLDCEQVQKCTRRRWSILSSASRRTTKSV